MKDKYVLEWSKKQNNFHIQKLEHTLAKNQGLFIDDKSHNWIVLMVGTLDVCTSLAESQRDRIKAREVLRPEAVML